MKPVSSTFLNFIINNQQMLLGELFTITLANGDEFYFTNLDIPITYDGHVFTANSLRIEGLRFKLATGWEVDEQEVRISAYPTETIGSAAVFSAIQTGLLDGAWIKRQRAFWQISDGRAFVDYAAAPLEVVTLFTGLVSKITKIGRTHIEMKVKSPLKLLDIDMPRNTYQSSCQWTLYDSGCGVVRASFTQTYTVLTADPANHIVIQPTTAISPADGADGTDYFLQGRLLFTSGVNDGLQTVVSKNDATYFWLQYPLVTLPAPGDTFEVSAGCAKRTDSCDLKFSNLANFRGFPRVPPVVLSV